METVVQSKATLPALAREIAKHFPELKNRAFAVAECDIVGELKNMPSLPVCMLGLIRETGDGSVLSNEYNPEEDFLVQFWFEPAKYPLADGGDSPFWSFYDYDTLRDRFVTMLQRWISPREQRVQYMSLEIDVDPYAVIISFRCRHTFDFCPYEPPEDGCTPSHLQDGQPVLIRTTAGMAQDVCCSDD